MTEPSLQILGVEPPRRRHGRLVAAVLGGALVLLAGTLTPLLVHHDVDANLQAVRVFTGLQVEHTLGSVHYPQTPPVGGPHDPVWLECGVYDDPVRDENAVHDLEHGTVWITYRPGLSSRDVALLTKDLPQNGLLSPYPGLPAPVVITVWGRQLRLSGADDPRIVLFVRRYGADETAPEPNMSCAGGATDPQGEHAGETPPTQET